MALRVEGRLSECYSREVRLSASGPGICRIFNKTVVIVPESQFNKAIPRVLRRGVVQITVAGECGEPLLQVCAEMRAVLPHEVEHRLGIGRAAKANPAVANFFRFDFPDEPGYSFAGKTATRFAEQIDPGGEVVGGTEDGLRPRLAESGCGYKQRPVVGVAVLAEPRTEMA